jgi:hypothetical protein
LNGAQLFGVEALGECDQLREGFLDGRAILLAVVVRDDLQGPIWFIARRSTRVGAKSVMTAAKPGGAGGTPSSGPPECLRARTPTRATTYQARFADPR